MMKQTIVCTVLLAAGVAALGSDAAQERAMAFIPLTLADWRLEVKTGDAVDLKESEGVFTLAYDVVLADYLRVGHASFIKGEFKLLLKKPLPLTPSQARVMFDALGVGGDNTLRPLLQDETGEVLSYEPHSLWALKKGNVVPVGVWVKWSTCSFWTSEAGGAASNIYDAEGGDGDAWPTGALRFLGFEGRMVLKAMPEKAVGLAGKERRKGVFNLAAVRLGSVRVPAEEPAFFADMVLAKKGKAHIGIEIRDAFQSVPYLEKDVEIDYDPADPVSRHQEIRFNVGPVKNSWISCGVTESGGAPSITEFRWEKNIPPGGTALARVDVSQPPAVGSMRINPDSHTLGVYKPGDSLSVAIRVFAKGAAPAKLLWTLTPYGFGDVLESGECAIEFKGAGYADLAVVPKGVGRDAWNLHVVLVDAAGKELEKRSYTLGIENAKPQAYASRTGMLRGRDFVKKASYFRTTYGVEKKFTRETEQIAHFKEMLDESMQMASYVTYMIDLAELEILPGVYNFAVLDQVMDAAADRGCAITVRVGHGEQGCPYRWLPYTLPRNFDGEVIPGHRYYGAFDYADKRFVAAWYSAFEALYARYKIHPGFQGYYLLQPAGEWALPDEPWNGCFSGYAWSDAALFRTYLQENLKFSLEQLNARWNTSYKEWSEVEPPLPDFSVGKKPDLRLCWLDFSLFRQWLNHWWFPAASAHIRTFDKDHVIIDYGGRRDDGEPEEGVAGNADYLHNGGNHSLGGEGTLTQAWDRDALGWITEPHHPHRWAAYGDPAEKGWVLDWSVFVMTAQAGGGGANLHVYYWPNPTLSLTAHYAGAFAYDRYEMFKPILRELQGVKLQQKPKQVAVIQDDMTLMLKHRTVFGARLADLRHWFELLKLDAVDYEFYRKDNEANYKLVVLNPLDEVIGPDMLAAVVRMANNGALVTLSAKTGRFCPGTGDSGEYPLLRALGIPAPAGAFKTDGDGGAAQALGDSVCLTNGATLKFFSQGAMRRELSDPEYGKTFWQWPYRWIPESDYFGWYPENKKTGGRILAAFPDGGAAVTLHDVGKGKALVFWGVPDMKPELLKGLMARVSRSAGVVSPRAGNPIVYALEADHKTLKRHYALLYQETPGEYVQKLPGAPDGEWFIDDTVCGHRYGVFAGETLRTRGITLVYTDGDSPLKILRMIPKKQVQAPWADKYGSR